jgi:2-oxoglutarate ferredoxin oxidoreductase subunit alpha
MSRVSLKIVGASGQGINSIGEILAKGFKRGGYCVFGYREYPSLIKGGHASYQLDVSPERIESTELKIDMLVTLNHHGLEINLPELKDGGILVHSVADWKFTEKDLADFAKRRIRVVNLPVDEILKKMNAKPILGNVLIAAFLWAACGQSKDALKTLVGERFAKKKNLLDANMQCIEEGFGYTDPALGTVSVSFPAPDPRWADHLLVTGSHAMGLGAVHAGVRLYAGYPMTPSSPLLSFIAELQNHTGMVIKQAEDEITAAQIVSGAMHMGTRALTGTSGGGFDLMSETVSLNGIIENPTVFVLAQRPGPATGLPTWTAQADLMLAVGTAHGEFARCVISVSDSQDAFDLMPVAFNLAEQFQISVIVLTDKQIAEALYTQPPYNLEKATVERFLVTDEKRLEKLQGTDRFDPSAKDGISPRWLPGTKATTYNAQGDEHHGDGTVDESAENAKLQMEKRMRKMEALKRELPEPELFMLQDGAWKAAGGEPALDLLIVGWGSTRSVVMDALQSEQLKGKAIGYLHYAYMWPLKTGRFTVLEKKAKRTLLIEGNYTGQLGMLLRMETGVTIERKILKYDGRPFFYDELIGLIAEHCGPAPRAKAAKTPAKKDNARKTPLSNEPRD